MKKRLAGLKRVIYVTMIIAGMLISTVFSYSDAFATVSGNDDAESVVKDTEVVPEEPEVPSDDEEPAAGDTEDEKPAPEEVPEVTEPAASDPVVSEPAPADASEVSKPASSKAKEQEVTDADNETGGPEASDTADDTDKNEDVFEANEPVKVEETKVNDAPDNYLEIPSNSEGAVPMGVDGYFDDWAQVPESQIQDITYGSHDHSSDVREHHAGKMIIRDGYVYVNIQMSDLYVSQIPTQYLGISINGQERWFNILGKDENGNPEWDRIYNLSVGRNTGLGLFVNGDTSQMPAGDAAVTTTGNKGGDAFEFRVSIADLEKYYGLPEGTISNGALVEFYSPNIGPQHVTCAGTSSGSRMGVGFGVTIAGLAMMLEDIKKRRKAK